MRETSEGLARAFDRLDDFQAVQRGVAPDEFVGAVARLQESVGIEDDERSMLVERLAATRGVAGAPAAGVLLGLIIGLMAAQES